MKKQEFIIQSNAFAIVSKMFPKTHGLLFHVPNGGSRNVREAANLKRTGVVAGIPDMLFLWKGKTYAFEFKSEKGCLSDSQKAVHEQWKEHGVEVQIIRTQFEFVTAIQTIITA
jgi:hypothetical protein